jgi:hypothetical protein
MTAKFTASHSGMGQLLRSRMMEDAMLRIAEDIKHRAEGLSPVGTRSGGRVDVHPGRYKASWKTRSHVSYTAPGRYGGGRAEAIVYNDAPEALYVEYGHHGTEPDRVLARAAFITRRRRL